MPQNFQVNLSLTVKLYNLIKITVFFITKEVNYKTDLKYSKIPLVSIYRNFINLRMIKVKIKK